MFSALIDFRDDDTKDMGAASLVNPGTMETGHCFSVYMAARLNHSNAIRSGSTLY
jgi:hypothetical protein